jgi:N-dimethylarginine dimethylaminohydrolase
VLAALGLRYELRLESTSGVELRWGQGLVRRRSLAEQRVLAAWAPLTHVLREHGVSVQEHPPGASSPDA